MKIGRSTAVTDTGRRRMRNEDAFVFEPPLFAIADGMGGARAGEVAAGIAAAALKEGRRTVTDEASLGAVIDEANRRVWHRSVTDPGTDTATGYRILWYDGLFDTYTTTGPKTHTYTALGTYNIRVDEKDEDSGACYHVGSATKTINVVPSDLWVDDNWVGTPPGNDADPGSSTDGTAFGVDQFATITSPVNSVILPGVTIHVFDGTYAESVGINQTMTLLGAQAGGPPQTLVTVPQRDIGQLNLSHFYDP